MTETECRCGKPTRDHASVCHKCAAELTRALTNVPMLVEELETTTTRQRAVPINGGAASAEIGLPWHERASEAQRNLHSLLVSWVRFCRDEHIRKPPTRNDDWPDDNLPALSGWLLDRVHGLTLHDIGPDAVEEITDAVADCRRVVFYKRRQRTYLGTCGLPINDDTHDGNTCTCACHNGYSHACDAVGGCGLAWQQKAGDCPGEVYASPGADVGYCDDCGRGHTVVIRRAELEKKLDDLLCTPAEIARMSTFLGLDVPRAAVRSKVNYWSRHKRITPSAKADNGDPMFRYGEVRALLAREFATATPEPRGA